jgi:drug/metabolite transporter (DMT)-like permease
MLPGVFIGLLASSRGFWRRAISLEVFLIVLLAAAMHASWNAILKIRLEPLLAMLLIHVLLSFITIPLVFVVGLPKPESWPWMAGSVIIHLGYYFALSEAYRRADMSQVYPIARGSAPLMTAAVSIGIIGDKVSSMGIAGIVLLGIGIFVMSIKSAADAAHMDRKAMLLALGTAVTVSAYTVTDGTGARLSGNPWAYSIMLFACEGIIFGLVVVAIKGRAFLRPSYAFVGPGLAGAVLSGSAYGITIWAMTVAPIPLVAAVREASVLFATAIAVIVLKEPLRLNRVIAALLILSGLVLIRLQT